MIYGYARVSTKGQAINGNSLEEQKKKLLENGCAEIVSEQYSGKTIDRPKLDALIGRLKEGDTLVVTKLDRLARNTEEGIHFIKQMFDRKVKVNILNVGTLDNTSLGNFFVTTLLAVAELERTMIIERMQEGKAIAKEKEGYREGRPRQYTSQQREHAASLIEGGESYAKVAQKTGMSKSTLIRLMKERRMAKER